jgi:L-cysteine/cystine lyase
MVSPFLPDDEKVAAIRRGLPATAAGIYLNTGTSGPLPRETALAMAEAAEWEVTVGRSNPDFFPLRFQRLDEARAAVAAVLTVDLDAVALTHSTSDGMNIGTWGVDWRPGVRAVTSSLEHPGGFGALYVARDRFGVDLAIVDVGDGGDDEATVAAFDAAITPATKLVSISHVTWSTGAVLPVARIAEIARARGALVVVDGAQSGGAIAVDPAGIGADVYAVPAQKWLLGPEGMGALWVRRESLERVARTFAGYLSFETMDGHGTGRPWPSARRYEAGNFHDPSVVGMARSCGWLSMYVGLDWAVTRAGRLARSAADRLAAIPGVELVTPRHQMATLVTFRIAGWPSQAIFEELSHRVFAITRTIAALDAVRISVAFFNTDDEIRRFCGAVAELAAHTPETLPPRPSLTILGQAGE